MCDKRAAVVHTAQTDTQRRYVYSMIDSLAMIR